MARAKNRGIDNAVSFPHNVMRWNLAEYIRLSKEDLTRGKDESNSVVNQRKLLDDYYKQHIDEFESAAQYIDDGCTARIPTARAFKNCWPILQAKKSTA